MNILVTKKSTEINITELINIVKTKWLVILLAGVLVAAISFVYSNFFIVPQYRATAQMFVDTRRESSEGKDTYIQSSHITAAKELAPTYVHIIKTNTVMNAVIDQLGLDMSSGELSSKIGISIVDSTQILKISVTDADRDKALKIAEKLVEVTPMLINVKIDSGKLISIDNPSVSAGPVSPNISGNTVVGFAVGVILLFGLFVIQNLLDNKIKTTEEIQQILDIPVLGVIPALEHTAAK